MTAFDRSRTAADPGAEAEHVGLRRGDHGAGVNDVRSCLQVLGLLTVETPAPIHTTFDSVLETAVRCFQQGRGLIVDGIVGTETCAALRSARWRLGDRRLSRVDASTTGDDVAALQEWLLEMGYDVGRPDGVFGSRTEAALITFQREVGVRPDGICGPGTVEALGKLGRRVVGGRPLLMRENEMLRLGGSQLAGKRILIDPGHGGTDQGACHGAVSEAAITDDLARRLVGRLLTEGVDARSTHDLAALPVNESTRAQRANELPADLLLSLHVDAHPNPDANGLATYHFGTGSGVTSTVGEQVAALVQAEVLARVPFTDCRTHGKSWELLRCTRMPAVRVELGYLTSEHDRAILADPRSREAIADGLVAALRRVYLPIDLDGNQLVTAV